MARCAVLLALAAAAECFSPSLRHTLSVTPTVTRKPSVSTLAPPPGARVSGRRQRPKAPPCMCAGVEPSSREPLFKEELNLLYDSKCSVCQWEVDMLTSLGAEGKILFTDIEAPGFDQASPLNGGVSYEEAMKSMTAVTRHGEILSGVPVFEALYKQVGFGWLFTAARLPIVGSLVDGAYLIFAAFRTSLTRGKSVQELIAERNAALASCEPCQSKVEL